MHAAIGAEEGARAVVSQVARALCGVQRRVVLAACSALVFSFTDAG